MTGFSIILTFKLPGISFSILWKKKNLPASDVQYVSSGTNPTGCLRLTQAGWKVAGHKIDQTKYFREDVFGSFDWEVIREEPWEEGTKVLFSITILGKYIGQYRLQVRHKPSGEAGQRNYTTSISWGEVMKFLGKPELVGKTLLLYAPPPRKKEPFHIEIV